MADLREALRLITNSEPTPEQIQRVQAIAHALDIPKTDAMLPILVVLDVYHGAFTRLPAECQMVAEQVAAAAGQQAQAMVDDVAALAIKGMVPTFCNSMEKAALAIESQTRWLMLAVSFAVAAAIIAMSGMAVWKFAHQAGFDAGYLTAKQELPDVQQGTKRTK